MRAATGLPEHLTDLCLQELTAAGLAKTLNAFIGGFGYEISVTGRALLAVLDQHAAEENT